MEARFDDATEAFRLEVRAWLEAHVPKEPMPATLRTLFTIYGAGRNACSMPAGLAFTGPNCMAGAVRRCWSKRSSSRNCPRPGTASR